MDFGKNLKTARRWKGVTQIQTAADLGISKATIAYYEVNKRQPDLEMLVKLANYFDVTTDFLLDNEKH